MLINEVFMSLKSFFCNKVVNKVKSQVSGSALLSVQSHSSTTATSSSAVTVGSDDGSFCSPSSSSFSC